MIRLDYLGLVFKDIENRKFSSFLTFFAISLGILSIFVIILVSQGFEQSIAKEFEKIGTNRIIIQSDGSSLTSFKKGLTDNEVKLIGNKPYVIDSQPYYMKTIQLEYNHEFISRLVLGANLEKDFFDDFNVEVEYGRYPKLGEENVVVMGPVAANDLFKKKINVGSNIYVEGNKFKVVGILKSLGNPEDDKNIYFNINKLREIYDDGDVVHMIYASVDENYDVKLAAENIEVLLENRLGDDSVVVSTLDQFMESFNQILGIVQMTLGGIAFVSLIVGAFGIINTMFVIITEKTKDIGIMKAIGARNEDIFFIYIFQAGLFGFLGGVLGMFMGSFGALGFEAWAKSAGYTFLEITINVSLVGGLLLFSFLIGAFAGFVPAYRASRLQIVETFRK